MKRLLLMCLLLSGVLLFSVSCKKYGFSMDNGSVLETETDAESEVGITFVTETEAAIGFETDTRIETESVSEMEFETGREIETEENKDLNDFWYLDFHSLRDMHTYMTGDGKWKPNVDEIYDNPSSFRGMYDAFPPHTIRHLYRPLTDYFDIDENIYTVRARYDWEYFLYHLDGVQIMIYYNEDKKEDTIWEWYTPWGGEDYTVRNFGEYDFLYLSPLTVCFAIDGSFIRISADDPLRTECERVLPCEPNEWIDLFLTDDRYAVFSSLFSGDEKVFETAATALFAHMNMSTEHETETTPSS